IPIPNGSASGPVACRTYVHGSGRYVDRGWLIVAWAARYRRSKQCTNGQPANNTGGHLTTACNCRPGCNRQTKTACDQQTGQKLSHVGPLRASIIVVMCVYAKFMGKWRPERGYNGCALSGR